MKKPLYLSLCFAVVLGLLATFNEVKAHGEDHTEGTASISGTVTDDQSEPVSGATIKLKNKKSKYKDKGTTGTSGEYEFSGLEAGKYQLTFKKSGYSKKKKKVKLEDGEASVVDIQLKTKGDGSGSGSGSGGGSGGGSGSGSGSGSGGGSGGGSGSGA